LGGYEQADGAAVELSIGELSERTGCPIETIRYYERAGVLRAPPRTASGRRVYGDAHVRQLNFARRARDLGFSLERIRQLMRLAEQPQEARSGARAIAQAHLTEVQQRMIELQRMVGELEGVLAQCASGAGPDCPILSALAEPR
jgi:MerR family transcriptional regulator, mercuric resistance operon regulatory protein